MGSEPGFAGSGPSRTLSLLTSRYCELAEVCYKVLVSRQDERGRFRRGHRAREPHAALLKKLDLDRELAHIYSRFFGPNEAPPRPISISTSNSRPQGSDTRMLSAADPPSSWET